MHKKYHTLKNVILFLIAFLFFTILSVTTSDFSLDNSWNYHFMQKIYDGFTPYNDFNIIIPPLFHYIGALFILIFGNKFYILNIFSGLISATLLFVCSFLITSFVKPYKSRFAAISLITLLIIFLNSGANYNSMILIFIFSILLLENKITEKNKNRYRIFQGILLGLAVLTKHTIGAYFSIAFYIYLLITSEKKQKIKSIIPSIISEIIIGIFFVIYLLLNHNFISFFNYCIGGAFDFAKENSFISSDMLPIAFLLVFEAPLLFNYIKNKSKKDLLFFNFCIASILYTFPIANPYHVLCTFFVMSIPTMYSMQVFFSDVKYTPKVVFSIDLAYAIIISTFLICTCTYSYSIVFYHPYKMSDEYNVYDYCRFVNKYMEGYLRAYDLLKDQKEKEGYNVYILSPEASFYGIPKHQNNGDLDLLLNGNLGYNGTSRVIEQLSKIEKPYFLKNKHAKLCFQESEEIEQFIVNNYKYTYEIYNDMRVFISK